MTHDEGPYATAAVAAARPPRLLAVCLEYPPQPFGVSVLSFRQIEALAALYRTRLGLAEGAAVPIRVVAPIFAGRDTAPMPPIPGVEECRFRAPKMPIARLLPMFPMVASRWFAFRPEVVYCTSYRALGPIVGTLGALTGVPYVNYYHGSEVATELRSRTRTAIVRRYARGAAGSLANSDFTRRFVEEHLGPLRSPARQVSPHLDPRPFDLAATAREETRARLGSGPGAGTGDGGDRRVLLTLCQLNRRKAVDVVLEALALLRADDARRGAVAALDYWVAGDGPARDALVGQARALGFAVAEGEAPWPREAVGPRVRFLGLVKPGEVAGHFAAADLFVLVSRFIPESIESFGMVYLEAAAARLPVVGTDVGGVPSAVDAGETGLLVPPDAPDATADALHRLLVDPALARRLGRQGRERLEREFSAEATAERLLLTFERAVLPHPRC